MDRASRAARRPARRPRWRADDEIRNAIAINVARRGHGCSKLIIRTSCGELCLRVHRHAVCNTIRAHEENVDRARPEASIIVATRADCKLRVAVAVEIANTRDGPAKVIKLVELPGKAALSDANLGDRDSAARHLLEQVDSTGAEPPARTSALRTDGNLWEGAAAEEADRRAEAVIGREVGGQRRGEGPKGGESLDLSGAVMARVGC